MTLNLAKSHHPGLRLADIHPRLHKIPAVIFRACRMHEEERVCRGSWRNRSRGWSGGGRSPGIFHVYSEELSVQISKIRDDIFNILELFLRARICQ